jgi:hypothetical protein
MIFSMSKIPSPRAKFLMGRAIKNIIPRINNDMLVNFDPKILSIFLWRLLNLYI